MLKKRRRKTILGERKRKRRNLILIVSIVFTVSFLVCLVLLLRKESWQIKDIYIEGGNGVSHDDIVTLIEDILSEDYFFIVPRTSMFVYPSRKIKEGLTNDFTRLKDVQLDFEFPDRLRVSLKEYEPHSLWCSNTFEGVYDPVATSTNPISPDGDCFYIDQYGYIFDSAPNFSEGVYFKYYGGTEDPLKNYILDKEYFSELESFKEQLKDLGLDIVSLIINPDKTFVIICKDGMEVLVDRDIPLDIALDNFMSVLKDPDTELDISGDIEYIDLRYSRKVYYKINE